MHMRSFKSKILLSILLLFYSMSNLCFANILETQLSNEQVMLGDSFSVTYILNDTAANGSPDFSALQKDFRILNTNYGKAINMVNGVTSTQTFWRLQLQPIHAGELIIPEIYFGSDKSTAHKLVVITTPVNTKQSAAVFVHGEISAASPYVQSQVLYTFKLYFRTQLIDPRVELPPMKDVTFFPLKDTPSYQTTIDGNVYHVVEKTLALFPKKTGTITIAPLQFHALVVDDNNTTFNNPFDFNQPKALSVSTKSMNMSVRDVPANYQSGAWLPAKNISLTEKWSDQKREWESGTPVTRMITIEAQGLSAEQLPDLTIDKINGVNVYVDRPKRSNTVSKNMLIGVYEQKVTYIPNSTQSFTIPRLKMDWWNVNTHANAVAQLNERVVQIKAVAGTSNALSNIVSSSPSPITNTQATVIYKTPPASKPFYKSIWFWIACALLVVWIVTLWLMLRKKTKSNDKTVEHTHDISEKSFVQACHDGQAILAKQYLLSWAKTHWKDAPLNLAALRDIIRDESFNLALEELERALYAKKNVSWKGASLLASFQHIKKSRRYVGSIDSKQHSDPLPSLNPARAEH